MRDQQNLEATTSPRSLVGIIHNLSLFTSNPQLPISSLAPLKPAYQSLCLSDARRSIRCYFRWHSQSHIRANSILHLPTASHITCEPNSLPDSDFRGSRLSSLQNNLPLLGLPSHPPHLSAAATTVHFFPPRRARFSTREICRGVIRCQKRFQSYAGSSLGILDRGQVWETLARREHDGPDQCGQYEQLL